jgi:hypothetical protein
MHLLITLALIFSLLFLAVLGVSNIERELIRPPQRSSDDTDAYF